MSRPELTDSDIIRGIKDASDRDKMLHTIFKLRDWQGAAFAFVMQQGGNEDDAIEVAQNALIALYLNICNGKFNGQSTLKTYFLAIVKNQWRKRRDRHKATEQFDANIHALEEESVEAVYLKEEYREVFNLALAQIGERCKWIMELAMLETKMEEIALKMNLANADMAKKAAYRCRMDLRDFLLSHPAWLNRLKGL